MIRHVVEGETEDDEDGSGSEDDEVADPAVQRVRKVYSLRDGGLVLQKAGMEGFEDTLAKRLKKLSLVS